jgi:hypothetical protein
MFFLGQIGLVQRSSKVALKKKGALFGHSSWKTLIRDGDPHKEE